MRARKNFSIAVRLGQLAITLTLGLGLTLLLLWLLDGAHTHAAPTLPVPSEAEGSQAKEPFTQLLFAPVPTSTIPGPNALNAPLTSDIAITFDEPISLTSVTSRTFAVYGSQTSIFTGVYSLSNLSRTVTLDPARTFFPGERVNATVTTATLNITGEQALSATVWQFWAIVHGGSGRFADSGQSLNEPDSYGVALGDVDSDGDLDAFIANWLTNTVWLNDGSGVFSDSGQILGSADSCGVALGDVDGDGDLDAYIANANYSANTVWLNDGSGVFSDSGQSLGSAESYDVALADVDGDGDLDAFVANYLANTVWLNDGAGVFSDSGQSLGNADSYGVALGDVDGDSDLDAFVANWLTNTIWLNDGAGLFSDSGQSLGDAYSYDVALGDVDGDGDLDAYIANWVTNTVWSNDGSGLFSDSGQSLGDVESYAVALGDVDGDGDMDAYVANGLTNTVWLNDGSGLFSDSGQSLASSGSQDVALGDVDSDGDLDAFVVNTDKEPTRVWLNQSRADLSLSKAVTPSAAAPGQAITYTLAFTNNGPQTATGVVITDAVPSEQFSVFSYQSSGAAITETGVVSYVWDVADLASGQNGVITITGVLSSPLAAGTFTNTATITTTAVDATPGDNSSDVALTVQNVAPVANDAVHSVDENSANSTPVGTVNASDANGDSLSYGISDGNTGDAFAINGGTGAITVNDGSQLNHETTPSYILTVVVTDTGGLTDTATITVNVNDVNEAPTVNNQSFNVDENSINGASVDTVAANDPDDGDTLSYAITAGNTGDAFAINSGTGAIIVNDGSQLNHETTPSYTLTVVVTDTGNLTDTATITVNINDVNEAPDAVDDTDSTNEDTPITINVLTNDGDPDTDDTLSVSAVGAPDTYGSTSTDGATVTYTPTNRTMGYTAVFTYTASDGSLTDTATVTVTVTADNDAPTAVDDTDSTNEDTPITISVLTNDGDPEDDTLSVSAVGAPDTYGSTSTDGATVTYTPTNRTMGYTAVFTYTASDGSLTDTATVTVTVDADADVDLTITKTVTPTTTTPSQAITYILAFTNNGPEPATGVVITDVVPVSVTNTSISSSGVTITNTGASPSYAWDVDDLAAGVGGVITITGQLSGTLAAGTFTNTATITTTAVDATPGNNSSDVALTVQNMAPVAVDDVAATAEDTPRIIAVLANDSDLNGDSLSIGVVAAPTNGQASIINGQTSIVYTPTLNYHGTDVFAYTASDGILSDTATVTVTVESVNDAPIAAADTITADEDTIVTIPVLDNDTDVEGDSLSVGGLGSANHGALATDGNDVTYAPAANFNGTDAFTYTVRDVHGGADTAIVTVTVNAVNDRPDAVNDVATTDEETGVEILVLTNDSDPENDPLSIITVGNPANGVVTISNTQSLIYTPNSNYHGDDSFSYAISDGNGGTDAATVVVTVNPINDAPVAVNDAALTEADTSVDVDVLANDSDVDGDTLFVSNVTQGSHGAVSINAAGAVKYAPQAGFSGLDSFTYTISDGNGGSDMATVTIIVGVQEDAVDAVDDVATTNEDTAAAIAVLSNDTCTGAGALVVFSVGNPAHGSVIISGAGVVYTPATNYNGPDSFSYIAGDGAQSADSATVALYVDGVNDAPDAVDDIAALDEDTYVDVPILDNDSDVDGDMLGVSGLSQPDHGLAILRPNGGQYKVRYIPDANYYGPDSFNYTVSDGNGGFDTATIAVTVNPINDAPGAIDDPVATDEDTPVDIHVLANDSDVEGHLLTIVNFGQGQHGTVVTNTDGSLRYIPDHDYNLDFGQRK